MASQPCVFCRIAAGDIPSHRVLESDSAIAFLDVGPLAEFHTLLIPRRHYDRLDQMPAEEIASLGRLLPTLGAAVCRVSGAPAFNVLQNNGAESGQVVPHVHFHIIPRRSDDGLGYRWNAGTYAPGRAAEVARALAAQLSDQPS